MPVHFPPNINKTHTLKSTYNTYPLDNEKMQDRIEIALYKVCNKYAEWEDGG